MWYSPICQGRPSRPSPMHSQADGSVPPLVRSLPWLPASFAAILAQWGSLCTSYLCVAWQAGLVSVPSIMWQSSMPQDNKRDVAVERTTKYSCYSILSLFFCCTINAKKLLQLFLKKKWPHRMSTTHLKKAISLFPHQKFWLMIGPCHGNNHVTCVNNRSSHHCTSGDQPVFMCLSTKRNKRTNNL